ncbi:hypothetical protein FZEAL_723 [Fusarium zealandicum]|uniref:NmrA-like domain-containing protein n=1 Tax=Fusarium zealandicum TaxID=1053134 RepID=A0A8H4UU79_9HYPO|nr:hypothetical protein FZEAL_723 [Fusarium zealandicum]
MATYLITQATGQQSQWTIKHLLEAGAKIHAVVRDLEKVPSALKEPSITLFQGESEDFDDILKAVLGCKGVFLNTVPFQGLETLQAKTVVEAFEQLHEYFASKAEVEDIVRAGNFKSRTILRPAVIHHDFLLPGAYGNFPRLPTHGEIDDLLIDGAKVPYTDSYDVGKYAASALQDPAKLGGQEIDLANELLDFQQVREILIRISGREVRVAKRTPEEVEQIGNSVFGQKFQLFANFKDLSSLLGVAKEVQAKFVIHLKSRCRGTTLACWSVCRRHRLNGET